MKHYDKKFKFSNYRSSDHIYVICVNLSALEKRREENQLDATECFIAIKICSTCFGHSYAHHQELETILVFIY